MTRFQKECDGMPRDELEKRFVILQEVAKHAETGLLALHREEEILANTNLRMALKNYFELEQSLSHDD